MTAVGINEFFRARNTVHEIQIVLIEPRAAFEIVFHTYLLSLGDKRLSAKPLLV